MHNASPCSYVCLLVDNMHKFISLNGSFNQHAREEGQEKSPFQSNHSKKIRKWVVKLFGVGDEGGRGVRVEVLRWRDAHLPTITVTRGLGSIRSHPTDNGEGSSVAHDEKAENDKGNVGNLLPFLFGTDSVIHKRLDGC